MDVNVLSALSRSDVIFINNFSFRKAKCELRSNLDIFTGIDMNNANAQSCNVQCMLCNFSKFFSISSLALPDPEISSGG